MDIAPPEKNSFDTTKWLALKQCFEHFILTLNLCNKTGENQVAMLVYAMGEKAKNIFALFKLSAHDNKKYDIVLQTFENHFIMKKNKKYERSHFTNRVQEERESAESFITAVHKLA